MMSKGHYPASFLPQPRLGVRRRPAPITVYAPWLSGRVNLFAMFVPRQLYQAGLHRGDLIVCLKDNPMPVVGWFVVANLANTTTPALWRVHRVTDTTLYLRGGRSLRIQRQCIRTRRIVLGHPIGFIRGGLAEAEIDAEGAIVLRQYIQQPELEEPTPCPDHGGA